MKKQFTIVANWKMFLGYDASIAYAVDHYDAFAAMAGSPRISLILAPTLPAISKLATIFNGTGVQWAAQDCSSHLAGAYTGQVSAETIKSIDCNACIIGHSERRMYNGEADSDVAQKLQMLLDYGLAPIICIGESCDDFKSGNTRAIVEQQLKQIVAILVSNQHKINGLPVYIAYEPVWAIGSGVAPAVGHLETMFALISGIIKKQVPAINLHLLYGGSVNSQTITLFKKIDYIHGFLVGKASLDFQEFEKILKCIMVE